jgi:hypothetical protein
MADRYSQVPTYNNIQCVPEDVFLSAKYSLKNPDKYWFNEAIQSWQTERCYKQPIRLNDKQYFELHRQDANDCYFEIYNAEGIKIQDRVDADFVIYDTNSVYTKPDGTDVPLTIHKWHFRFSTLKDNDDEYLDEGVYILRFVVEFYNESNELEETRYWISEPLDVKEEHEDTILLEYYNDSNKEDVIFKYDIGSDTASYKGVDFYSPKYGLRVQGTVMNPDYDGHDFEMQDQEFENRQLDGFAWTTHELVVGGSKGVPKYMIDKFNKLIRCDYLVADGFGRVSRESGSKLELQSESVENPLYKARVKISHYDRQDVITDTRAALIDFVDLSGGYPCGIHEAGFAEAGFAQLIGGVVLNNDDDKFALISYLNSVIVDSKSLDGEFIDGDTKIQYQNGDSENYTRGISLVNTNYLEIEINAPVDGSVMYFWMLNSKSVLDTGKEIATEGMIFQQKITSSGSFVYPHRYYDTGSYILRLFMDDTTEQLHMIKNTTLSAYTVNITNVTGNVPQGIVAFGIEGADFSGVSGGFNMNILARGRQNIANAYFINCGINALNGNVFVDYPSVGITGNSANWSQIVNLSIKYNQLDATETADFITYYYDWAGHYILSVIDLVQLPNLPIVDATALADIAQLQYAGHAVYY